MRFFTQHRTPLYSTGFSLLELTMVTAILGIISAVAIASFGKNTLDYSTSHGFATRIQRDIRYARRCAISTGLNHILVVTSGGSYAVSYQLHRREANGLLTPIDASCVIPSGIAVDFSDTIEMDFQGGYIGSSAGSIIIRSLAPTNIRNYKIYVHPITGLATVDLYYSGGSP